MTELSNKPPTTSRTTPVRCVNLDWCEVHAREPIDTPHNADYFRAKGFVVHEREYGTRVYREMFTLEGTDGQLLLEVRRNPASQGLNGIHDPNESHIRLCNRTCYFNDAAAFFYNFLISNGYSDIRISRIDLCLDFVMFDKGDDPQAFVRRYFRGKYAKINQGNIAGHGKETWSGRDWNSIAWGSKQSAVSTKMYNKTMELYNPKDDSFGKPYIREAWLRCGFIDDMQRVTKDGVLVNVWRVEFSLKSAVKNWIAIELDGDEKKLQSLRNNLLCYDTRDKILVMFASLARHYFRFKKYKKGKRKDACPDKVLFDFSSVQLTYKIEHDRPVAAERSNFLMRLNKLIARIKEYQQSHMYGEVFKACEVLISAMTEDTMRADLANPWSREELMTIRELMSIRTRHKDLTYEAAMEEVKKLLNITNRTISTF